MNHGRLKDFFQVGSRGFFQNFSSGEQKVVKFVFSHSKLENNLFFLKMSKFRGGLTTCPPSDAYAINPNSQVSWQSRGFHIVVSQEHKIRQNLHGVFNWHAFSSALV